MRIDLETGDVEMVLTVQVPDRAQEWTAGDLRRVRDEMTSGYWGPDRRVVLARLDELLAAVSS